MAESDRLQDNIIHQMLVVCADLRHTKRPTLCMLTFYDDGQWSLDNAFKRARFERLTDQRQRDQAAGRTQTAAARDALAELFGSTSVRCPLPGCHAQMPEDSLIAGAVEALANWGRGTITLQQLLDTVYAE